MRRKLLSRYLAIVLCITVPGMTASAAEVPDIVAQETEEASAEESEEASVEESEEASTEESEEASAEESGEASVEESEEASAEESEEASVEESEEASTEESEETSTEETEEASAEPTEKDELEYIESNMVAAPGFAIKGIFGGRSVTFTSATEGAAIYYKSGSSNITVQDSSVPNGGTVNFSSFYGTIYAKAYLDGKWSEASKFVLKIPVVNTPQITVAGDKVTIKTTTPSSYICYTTDGSKPSWQNGKRLPNSGGTITVNEGSTVRAVAVRSCFTDSQEVKAYVPVLPVEFNVKGVFGGRNVTMTSKTNGAVIYYSTKTGSITTADKMLKNGESLDFTNYYGTVYARAYKNGKWSNVSRLILKIPKVNTPTITASGNSVTVKTTTPTCYICYTLDGSEPSPTNGTMVMGSELTFEVSGEATVKAIAVRSCFTNSETVSIYVKPFEKMSVQSSGGYNYTPCSGTSTARWSHVMRCYIYQNPDGTISTVDSTANGDLRVDRYSKDWKLQESKTLTMELPLFGGFYAGKTYNYIVFGQNNPNQSNSVVTFKVVKYDKNWNRLGAADYSNNNTTYPFDAGSLRMTEAGEYLYVRTAHEMYSGHQANVTFSVKTDTMQLIDEVSEVWNTSIGYVSHSFNQFIAIDDGYLVGVDHGDAYPRAVVLLKSTAPVQDGKFADSNSYRAVYLLDIPGATGANCTGVTVGGFEVSEDNYLVAINTIDHSKVTEYTSFTMTGLDIDERDIVLLVSGKDNTDSSNVQKIKLTDYVNNKKLGSTPYLIKIGVDKYVVMWEEYDYQQTTYSWGTYYNKVSNGVKYIVVDGKGNKLTQTTSIPDAELSYNCQPVYLNNEIVWYVNESTDRTVYRLYIE